MPPERRVAESRRPKVSVSVVTYNHRSFLGSCLDSVLAQETRFPFEIVIGDDASNDGARDVIRVYADKHPELIHTVIQPANVGAGRNWQAVLDECQGEYIAHLDGDDLMLQGKLQRQADALDATPSAAMCFHNMRVFDSETGRTLRLFTPHGGPRPVTLDDIVRYGTVYCHSSKMYRRSALPSGGLDLRTRFAMDWLVHLENARSGEALYVDEILGEYRRHEGSTTSNLSTEVVRASVDDQLHTLARAEAFGATPDAIATAGARIWLQAALQHLSAGRDSEFEAAIERCVATGAAGVAATALHVLRHWPALASGAVKGYERLVVRPRLAATSRGLSPTRGVPNA